MNEQMNIPGQNDEHRAAALRSAAGNDYKEVLSYRILDARAESAFRIIVFLSETLRSFLIHRLLSKFTLNIKRKEKSK